MDNTVETAIANVALTKLGASRILNISDDVKAARAIRALWDIVRDAELNAHNWCFAIRRTTLPALEDVPPWGFNNTFQLPDDCLRVIQVDDFSPGVSLTDYRHGQEPAWQIETSEHGRRILTDIGAPLKIRYVGKVDATGLWDASFKMAFASRLAMELCEELTQSGPKRQLAQTEYMAAIREAVRNNAIEKPPEPHPDSEWILCRL